MLTTYLRGVLGLAAKPSWNLLNGVFGGVLSAVAAVIWPPLDLGLGSGWQGAAGSFVIYAIGSFVALYVATAAIVGPYLLWLRDRRDTAAPGLEILFDENDPTFVRDLPSLYNNLSGGRRWHVAVRNLSAKNNIDDVSLRAREGRFVRYTIAVYHQTSERTPIILTCATLAPGATEYVELFGVSGSRSGPTRDLLEQRHTFVLEARGRDTSIVLAEFEFLPGDNPAHPGTVRRLS